MGYRKPTFMQVAMQLNSQIQLNISTLVKLTTRRKTYIPACWKYGF